MTLNTVNRARPALRIAGLVLGVAEVGFGVFFLLYPDYPDSLWRSYVVPASFMCIGAMFIRYGVSGRS